MVKYAVIEITHDTQYDKLPFARMARYAAGNIRLWDTSKGAAKHALEVLHQPNNGVIRVSVEPI